MIRILEDRLLDYTYGSKKLKDQINAVKKDIRTLAKCDSFEDVENAEWYSWRMDNIIQMRMNKEPDKPFDEIVDEEIESLIDMIKKHKDDLTYAEEYEKNAIEKWNYIVSNIDKVYPNLKIRSIDDYTITFEVPEGANHGDCIKFVDKFVDFINGSYYMTGRGGSWTSWHIRDDKNIKYEAGWGDGHFHTPEGTWYIELSSSRG